MDPSVLQGLVSLFSGLNSAANTGGNIYGSVLTKQLVDNILGGKSNVLSSLNDLQNNAQTNINGLQGPLVNNSNALAGQSIQNFLNGQKGYGDWISNALQGTGQFGQMANPNNIPGLSDYLKQQTGAISHGNQMANVAADFGVGGTVGQAPLLSSGSSLLSGNTPNSAFQQLLQQAAAKSIGNEGYTPQLNQVTQEGQQLLQQNPLAAQAGDFASQIFGKGLPLLPMDQVVSMAMNQNATQSQQQGDDLRRQLLNRTGTTGPAVASGSENELLNNLGNQALQNQSSAVTNAMLGQQGLQLQQSGLGNSLLSGVTGANLGYTGQGLNAILQGSSQAGQLQNILGNLGLGGGNLGLNTLSTGGNLLNSFNSSALGGLGADTSYLNSLNGMNQGLANAAFGTQTLNQSQLQNMYSALASMLGQGNTQTGQSLQGVLGGNNTTSNILQQYLSQLTQGGTSKVGLYSQTPNYPANFMQNLLGGSGGAVNPTAGINFGFNFGGGSTGGSPFDGFGGINLGNLGGFGGYDPFGGFGSFGGGGGSAGPDGIDFGP